MIIYVNLELFLFQIYDIFFQLPLELACENTVLVEIWNFNDFECTEKQKAIWGIFFKKTTNKQQTKKTQQPIIENCQLAQALIKYSSNSVRK